MVAVGTELLLGQIVDTNSSWIGEHLALSGIDSHFQTKVGDNLDRIILALRSALARSDAVIVCGGLGPTQDDITRNALARVMGVDLVRDDDVVERIRAMFGRRGRDMAANNLLQADVPAGASVITQVRGTAPGLICPVGHKVMYAVPGVPYEMTEMLERAVLPDLRTRAGEAHVIASRTLRTWGLAESTLAERIGPRLEALDAAGGNPTIAFLASGMEGIKVRITAKASGRDGADDLLAAEEAELRKILGDLVFGVDDETMEFAVGALLVQHGLTLGLAESVTGGLVASRIVNVAGASAWFKGSIVAYDSAVKGSVLSVPDGPVVSEAAALAMAEGARRVLGSDIGLAVTGVAGPAEQDGLAVGTVCCAIAGPGPTASGPSMAPSGDTVTLRLPGDRERIRQFSAISLLDMLRRRLSANGS